MTRRSSCHEQIPSTTDSSPFSDTQEEGTTPLLPPPLDTNHDKFSKTETKPSFNLNPKRPESEWQIHLTLSSAGGRAVVKLVPPQERSWGAVLQA